MSRARLEGFAGMAGGDGWGYYEMSRLMLTQAATAAHIAAPIASLASTRYLD
jgi:hypothetical protein